MKELWCGSRYEQLTDVAKIVLNSLHSRFMGHINYEGSQFCCSPFNEYNAAINQSLEHVWVEDYLVFLRDIVIAEQVVP
jgi:predicted nucleic acid binding AN1-type Zn finger protein